MSESCFTRLYLHAPLIYAKADLPLFSFDGTKAGQLFCLDINPEQSSSIEPEKEKFLGTLIFTGEESNNTVTDETVLLPAGVYLFSQKREALGKDDIICLAIEQQKDGLWERYILSDRLYVRHVYEDGKPVTQIFRPVTVNNKFHT